MGGAAAGVLGKLLGPGDPDDVPLWLTVLGGVGGMLLGDWLYTRIWDAHTPGIDWWRHTWQLGSAAALVLAAVTTAARRHAR